MATGRDACECGGNAGNPSRAAARGNQRAEGQKRATARCWCRIATGARTRDARGSREGRAAVGLGWACGALLAAGGRGLTESGSAGAAGGGRGHVSGGASDRSPADHGRRWQFTFSNRCLLVLVHQAVLW